MSTVGRNARWQFLTFSPVGNSCVNCLRMRYIVYSWQTSGGGCCCIQEGGNIFKFTAFNWLDQYASSPRVTEPTAVTRNSPFLPSVTTGIIPRAFVCRIELKWYAVVIISTVPTSNVLRLNSAHLCRRYARGIAGRLTALRVGRVQSIMEM